MAEPSTSPARAATPLPLPLPRQAAALAAIAIAASLAPAIVGWTLTPADPDRHAVLAWSLSGTLLLALVSRRLWPGLLLLAPWLVLAPIETWFVASYGRASDTHLLGILAETDSAEAIAWLGGIGTWLGVAALAGAAVAAAAVRAAWRSRLSWPARPRRLLIAGSAIAIALPWLVIGVAPRATAGDDAGIDREGLDATLRPLANAWPTGVPLRLAGYTIERRALADAAARLEDFRFGAHDRIPATPGSPRRIVVLVIGETSRPDRWQINGYHRETNPRLSAEPNVVALADMVSPWTWTRMAVPVMLTRKPADDRRALFAERSLVGAFRESGWRTDWLSAQSPLGPHDSSIALYAGEAHAQRYINPSDYSRSAALDGDLLPWFDDLLAREERRQLIVLHTLGSHFDYSHRYPADFDHFRPSLRDLKSPSLHDRSQRVALNNAYDNSVRYTDHVLAELITRLRRSGAEATLLYVSDHGENLFDGECGLSGHGHDTERDHRTAALFWYSDAYAAARPRQVQALRSHAASPLATTQVFASMLDAADIGFPGEDATRSFFSPDWRATPRIVQSGLDFDRTGRGAVCRELTRTGAALATHAAGDGR